jgi:hypothetical protein
MRHYLPLLLCVLLAAGSVAAAQPLEHAGESKDSRKPGMKMDCNADPAWCNNEEGSCCPEMRGRCGKRRGDWYGARQPVANATEARGLLVNYFTGHGYTVSEVNEKKWGFIAEIHDKNGKVVDRVMIDKRFGRIRSLY